MRVHGRECSHFSLLGFFFSARAGNGRERLVLDEGSGRDHLASGHEGMRRREVDVGRRNHTRRRGGRHEPVRRLRCRRRSKRSRERRVRRWMKVDRLMTPPPHGRRVAYVVPIVVLRRVHMKVREEAGKVVHHGMLVAVRVVDALTRRVDALIRVLVVRFLHR